MDMGRFRGRLGSHEGRAVLKLADGSLSDPGLGPPLSRPVACVAACTLRHTYGGAHWYGPTEYPLTDAGERAAVDEWQALHAQQLLTAPDDPAITREIDSLLRRLGTLTIESPVAMIARLRAVHREADALLSVAVAHARATGASWATVAAGLDMTRHAARSRYENPDLDTWAP